MLKKNTLGLSAMALMISLGVAACGGSSEPVDEGDDSSEAADEAEIKQGKSVRITAADDGATVFVNEGQRVIVKLSSNASTGYVWMIKTNDLGEPKRGNIKPSSGAVGASGYATFTWQTAGKTGDHALELVYQRPWAELSPPAKTFSVTLSIKGKSVLCGGFMGLSCGAGEYCDYAPEASCGAADHAGTCKPKPAGSSCMRPLPDGPQATVCGCDGKTYASPCFAWAAGISTRKEGACE